MRLDHPPTHRELCMAVCEWALVLPWCALACWEIAFAGGQADVLAVSSPRMEDDHAAKLAAVERARAAREEALALLAPRERAGFLAPPETFTSRHELTTPRPRIAVAEVKRTRSDLLADLREGKLLRYADRATHCYLAGTDEALGLRGRPGLGCVPRDEFARVLADLRERGLPVEWGVLRLAITQPPRPPGEPEAWIVGVEPLRASRALGREVAPPEARAHWTEQIARSLVYRVLGGRMEEAHDATAAEAPAAG